MTKPTDQEIVQQVIDYLDTHSTDKDFVNDVFLSLKETYLPIEIRWQIFGKLSQLGLLRDTLTINKHYNQYFIPDVREIETEKDIKITYDKKRSFFDMYEQIKRLKPNQNDLEEWQHLVMSAGYKYFIYERY